LLQSAEDPLPVCLGEVAAKALDGLSPLPCVPGRCLLSFLPQLLADPADRVADGKHLVAGVRRTGIELLLDAVGRLAAHFLRLLADVLLHLAGRLLNFLLRLLGYGVPAAGARRSLFLRHLCHETPFVLVAGRRLLPAA